jgi:hypothetical protein
MSIAVFMTTKPKTVLFPGFVVRRKPLQTGHLRRENHKTRKPTQNEDAKRRFFSNY